MADKKITALNLIDEADINGADLLHVVDDPSENACKQKIDNRKIIQQCPIILSIR